MNYCMRMLLDFFSLFDQQKTVLSALGEAKLLTDVIYDQIKAQPAYTPLINLIVLQSGAVQSGMASVLLSDLFAFIDDRHEINTVCGTLQFLHERDVQGELLINCFRYLIDSRRVVEGRRADADLSAYCTLLENVHKHNLLEAELLAPNRARLVTRSHYPTHVFNVLHCIRNVEQLFEHGLAREHWALLVNSPNARISISDVNQFCQENRHNVLLYRAAIFSDDSAVINLADACERLSNFIRGPRLTESRWQLVMAFPWQARETADTLCILHFAGLLTEQNEAVLCTYPILARIVAHPRAYFNMLTMGEPNPFAPQQVKIYNDTKDLLRDLFQSNYLRASYVRLEQALADPNEADRAIFDYAI